MNRNLRAEDYRWCCVQSGHRERYAIPRALHRAGMLDCLLTDIWVPPSSAVARIAPGDSGRRLRDRFHAELPRQRVHDCTLRALTWDLRARAARMSGEHRVLAHNDWWSDNVARMFCRHVGTRVTHVFSYCYEARALFQVARADGVIPVLGQIDPGPLEDAKVTEIVRRNPDYCTSFRPCAPEYYVAWRQECELAGAILVNSEWSRDALVQTGIEPGKIVVCPLVYSPPAEAAGWRKAYPAAFTAQRPLRVLFLGQCILRKGIAEAIAAAGLLRGRPVEFTFVGNTDIRGLPGHFGGARIRHLPRVSRAECHAFYREADVFLFPTHSDGFGLTQLEAQAWRLPLIASRFCAEVVRPEETGWVLGEVTAAEIARIIEGIVEQPQSLARFSDNIRPWPFTLDDLADRLRNLPTAEPCER